MKKFEYTWMTFIFPDSSKEKDPDRAVEIDRVEDKIIKRLNNDLGAKGWQLVCVEHEDGGKRTFYFQKEC